MQSSKQNERPCLESTHNDGIKKQKTDVDSNSESSGSGSWDEALQEDQCPDSIYLSQVDELFAFDACKHRKKVIGLYTEKGGVGKTNFILGTVRSNIYNKILIIDTDPQNNVLNGFMPPTFLSPLRGQFTTCSSFLKNGKLDNVFHVNRGPNTSLVDVVLGDPFTATLQMMYGSERNNQCDIHARRMIKHIRQALKDYDVVLIDFNSNMSLMNRILLMACDEVIQLVTGDIHSQAAITSLIKVRVEECKYFNVHPGRDDVRPYSPQRFNITIVPSLIDRLRNTLRAGHRAFVDKIFHFVKEKEQSDILFRGYIGRAQSIYGVRPVKMLKQKKTPGSQADTVAMINDIRRVLVHCINDTLEYMERHEERFPWKTVLDENIKPRAHALYLFEAKSPRDHAITYKIGVTTTVKKRRERVKSSFKKKWEFVKCWHSTRDIVMELEAKLLDYFSTNTQAGETVCLDTQDSRAALFQSVIKKMDSREFVESLLLES